MKKIEDCCPAPLAQFFKLSTNRGNYKFFSVSKKEPHFFREKGNFVKELSILYSRMNVCIKNWNTVSPKEIIMSGQTISSFCPRKGLACLSILTESIERSPIKVLYLPEDFAQTIL